MESFDKQCMICTNVALAKAGKNPKFIYEFTHSIFVVGDHQFHKGYSLVLFKNHIRELHDLPEEVQKEHFLEVMRAAKALALAFQPWKLNYSCYGNQVPHIHWHIFPRYDTEPDKLHNPWFHAEEFNKCLIDDMTAAELARHIRSYLK